MTLPDVIRLEPYLRSGYIAGSEHLPAWMRQVRAMAGGMAFSLFANRIRRDKVTVEDLVLGS